MFKGLCEYDFIIIYSKNILVTCYSQNFCILYLVQLEVFLLQVFIQIFFQSLIGITYEKQ